MAGAFAIAAASWFVGKWCIANSAVQRADTAELAVYLTQLAPDDPQAHHRAAVLFERNFDLAEVQKAAAEFEKAAALSPENYMMWLDLGRARERTGDAEGAERALRHALLLAPNYSRVQWTLGNALLRQGRVEEAFDYISKAVAGDATLAGPAAVAAWQFFDGDVAAIRRAITNSMAFDGALAVHLAREKRFDEAVAIWDSFPANEKKSSLKEVGTNLLGKLLEAKKFRDSIRVVGSLNDGGGEKPGVVSNGGFEKPVRPDGAGPFEWQIPAGLQPQIVLTTGQKHGGENSLLLVFNSTDGKEFRRVSQTIAVEPGKSHILEFFYRADIKTNTSFSWEVLNAADGKQIAVTAPIAPRADWTPLSVKFTTNGDADGVTIRLTRSECTGVCPVTGSIWFDDFSLRLAD